MDVFISYSSVGWRCVIIIQIVIFDIEHRLICFHLNGIFKANFSIFNVNIGIFMMVWFQKRSRFLHLGESFVKVISIIIQEHRGAIISLNNDFFVFLSDILEGWLAHFFGALDCFGVGFDD